MDCSHFGHIFCSHIFRYCIYLDLSFIRHSQWAARNIVLIVHMTTNLLNQTTACSTIPSNRISHEDRNSHPVVAQQTAFYGPLLCTENLETKKTHMLTTPHTEAIQNAPCRGRCPLVADVRNKPQSYKTRPDTSAIISRKKNVKEVIISHVENCEFECPQFLLEKWRDKNVPPVWTQCYCRLNFHWQ